MKKVGLILVVALGITLVLLLVRSQKDGFFDTSQSLQDISPVQNAEQTVSESPAKKTVVEVSSIDSERTSELILSDEVEKLLSSETSFAARSQFIKELSRSLSSDDITALREFLNSSGADYPKMSPIVLNSLKNDVLEVLMDQYKMPEGLGQQVTDMFNDPDSDYMWREYCLQFMGPLWEKGAEDRDQRTDDGDQRDAELETVRDTLFSALDERDEDLAGTALLGLDKLGKKYDNFDHSEVVVKAVEMAEDTNASARCRLTAMRVAASANSEDILSTARKLAQNAETDLLQGAAITTLGDFADPQDKELLTQLAVTGNRQIAAAARAALKRFAE